MLHKLKQRWKVNDLNLLLIITTFALGGSLCGYLGRKLLLLLSLPNGLLWTIAYIILISILWPFCVLLISIPLGQFVFFKKYLEKVWYKISGSQKNHVAIAIFASGAGTNAQKIINHFRNHPTISISLIVCNKPAAGVIKIAEIENIPYLLIEKKRFFEEDAYLAELQNQQINFIVLAGFLWKLPSLLIQAFPEKIINIHPAILPKYGGHGMYGARVHDAVIKATEKESGISIHFVDEMYDHGKIIFQATCPVTENDTAVTLAAKIHTLEHKHYPLIIEKFLQKQKTS